MNNIQAKTQVESGFLVKNMNKKSVRVLIGPFKSKISSFSLGQILDYIQDHMLKTIQNKANIRY